MRYLVRALKYFITLWLIICAALAIFQLIGIVEGGVESMFKGGWNAVWQIAALFALFSSIYPLLGYGRRLLDMKGDKEKYDEVVDEYMQKNGYVVDYQNDAMISYILGNPLKRLFKFWEDRINFTRREGGYELEGNRKEILRIIYSIENLQWKEN